MTKLLNLRNSKFLFALLIAGYWVACSPKTFSKDPSVNACQNFSETCVGVNGKDFFDYTKTANGGLVDILFVDDNSGSMSFEQNHMAMQFGKFLPNLDARLIDYRIGVITTDVSTAASQALYPDKPNFWTEDNNPRAINQNGALQDGNLISVNGTGAYITSDMADKETVFAQTIKRKETEQCENFYRQYPNSQPPAQGIADNCPSGDERGIFAANLFFDKNPSSFIRPNAHLAVVFLSDEDERSGLYLTKPGFELAPYDQPETLLNKINSTFSGKAASFHTVIVKNEACQKTQSEQMGPAGKYGITFNTMAGSIGYKYGDARRLTNGKLGDICASDDGPNSYGDQLGDISANIVDRILDMTLACANPSDLHVTLAPPLDAITWTVSGAVLHFSESLPPGTQVRLQYSCPTL